ncbi:MAG: sugar phosphate isomerase/epimerase [Waddliaceae bacterium]|nr:sugar phosphate isomerase/epimerase [Waddliaceae bacterium]MBT3579004.1 sugar phosphate isomerase/epimerase [Waddliaceae bacterium]MBT4444971.1 sugar phosphate isomerase/epimerase [Waddliaceae bacterium]MBT6928592.1 sugar phosphate isomerase/epimerase [Waddliaceae bacterium]MBT7264255.1 sugar phosphate isomerase/epimerase [Waddliaceae bacterium]
MNNAKGKTSLKLGIADMVANFVPGSGNPIGIPEATWQTMKPLEKLSIVIDIIKHSGFDYVELGIPWINDISQEYTSEDVFSLVKEKNMTVGSFCSLMPATLKVVGPNTDKIKIREYLENVFLNCSKIGGDVIVFGSGDSRNVPEGYSYENAEQDILNFLNTAAEIIERNKYDLKLVIESLNTEECNYINTLEEAYNIACKVDATSIGIVIDTFHAYRQKRNVIEEIPDIIDKVLHLHLAQPEDRRWPGSLQQEDSFDFIEFFGALKDNGYNGNATVECNFDNMQEQIGPCGETLKAMV